MFVLRALLLAGKPWQFYPHQDSILQLKSAKKCALLPGALILFMRSRDTSFGDLIPVIPLCDYTCVLLGWLPPFQWQAQIPQISMHIFKALTQ